MKSILKKISHLQRKSSMPFPRIDKPYDGMNPLQLAPVKVLCVDDDGHSLTVYEQTLGKDYDVYSAYNLHDARLLLGQHDFAVILCGRYVAGVDGIAFLNVAHGCLPGCVQLLLGESGGDHAAISQVFRHLYRPLSPSTLKHHIDDARDRYFLQLAQACLHQRL